MKLRDFSIAAWLGLGVSVLLIVWQLAAYLTDSIPGHILPLVRLISGTQEDIPVAYSWTLRIGFLSVLLFLGSLITLVGVYIFRRYERTHNTRNA